MEKTNNLNKFNLIISIMLLLVLFVAFTVDGTGGGGAPGGPGDCPDGTCPDNGEQGTVGDAGEGEEGSCFLPGTLITMLNGTQKVIEDIKVGEKVLGYDYINSKHTINEVLELENPVRKEWFLITTENGKTLKTTDDHPIYIEKDLSAGEIENGYKGWGSIDPQATYNNSGWGMKVEQLNIGDYLKTETEELTKIISILNIKEEVQTYNLKQVSNNNSFFAEGVLVHNKNRINDFCFYCSGAYAYTRMCFESGCPIFKNPINICSPNQGNTCQSNPNLCGEQGIGTIKCNGICNANIPPLASNYGDSCKTTEKNECHMIGLGYIGCDNECSATIPLIGQCADPEISDNNNNNNNNNNNPTGGDTGFRTSDNRYIVVKDTIKTLVWSDISNATSCTVTGPEDYVNNPFYTETYTEEESINGTISGTVDTLPIQHKSKFTLTCYNGPQDNPNTPTTQSSFYINLVPRYQEI